MKLEISQKNMNQEIKTQEMREKIKNKKITECIRQRSGILKNCSLCEVFNNKIYSECKIKWSD